MGNLLIASAAIVVVAFFAGFQWHAMTFRRRRRKHSGF
jgi:hypothetical protein